MNKEDIVWFKKNFQEKIENRINDTPFNLDFLVAIASQETGYLWSKMRKNNELSIEKILELCVGDTLDDTSGRSAFPKNKSDLLSVNYGSSMFKIARECLVEMANATNDRGYLNAIKNPNKFAHGYGIFQLDLQFFMEDPDYFLEKKWADFNNALEKCVEELNSKIKRVGYQNKSKLTDLECIHVGIAYNSGKYNPSKGLKQGYFDGSKYYGEHLYNFLKLSKSVTYKPDEDNVSILEVDEVTLTGDE